MVPLQAGCSVWCGGLVRVHGLCRRTGLGDMNLSVLTDIMEATAERSNIHRSRRPPALAYSAFLATDKLYALYKNEREDYEQRWGKGPLRAKRLFRASPTAPLPSEKIAREAERRRIAGTGSGVGPTNAHFAHPLHGIREAEQRLQQRQRPRTQDPRSSTRHLSPPRSPMGLSPPRGLLPSSSAHAVSPVRGPGDHATSTLRHVASSPGSLVLRPELRSVASLGTLAILDDVAHDPRPTPALRSGLGLSGHSGHLGRGSGGDRGKLTRSGSTLRRPPRLLAPVPTGPLSHAAHTSKILAGKPTVGQVFAELGDDETERREILEPVVNRAEQLVGADLDGDGDVGLAGNRLSLGLAAA